MRLHEPLVGGRARTPRCPGGQLANVVSLMDLCDRPPVGIGDGEVLDLGGRRVRHLDTPHVPHGWEARVLYEEATGTLLCGDLFTPPATSRR